MNYTTQPHIPMAAAPAVLPPDAVPLTAPIKIATRADAKDVGSYFGEPEPQKPTTTPPKAPEPPKPEVKPEPPKQPTEPVAKVDPVKPVEPAKPAEPDDLLESAAPRKPEKSTEPIQGGPRELREAYAKEKSEVARLKAEVEKLSKEGPKEIVESLQRLQTERDELAKKLAFHDYANSPEYEAKYVAPFKQTAASAYDIVKKLRHQIEERTGTEADVNELYYTFVRDPASAIEKAQESFGAASGLIMAKIETMVETNNKGQEAIQEWTKDSASRRALQQAEVEKRRTETVEIWKDQIERETATRPDIYNPGDDDPKIKDLYSRAQKFADAAFIPDASMTHEQMVRHQAKVRSMAAVLPVILAKNRALEDKLAKAEEALKEYEDGKPRIKSTGETQKAKKHGLSALEDYFQS